MSINYVDDKVSDAVLSCQRETLFVSNAHFWHASLKKASGPPKTAAVIAKIGERRLRLAAGELGTRLPIPTIARFRGYIREGTF